MWHLINDGTNKESLGFQKPHIFTVEIMHSAAQRKKNWFANLSVDYPVFMSPACLSALLLHALKTHPALLHEELFKHESKHILYKPSMLRTSNLWRNKLIVSQEIFLWEETATILPSIPLTSGMVMKSSTNPPVRFPVGPSQVLSRCSGYREGHNPGIVESRTHIRLPIYAGISKEDV